MPKCSIRNWHVYDVNCDCAAYTWAWMRPVQSGRFRRCIYCGHQLGDMQIGRYRLVRAKTEIEALQKARVMADQLAKFPDAACGRGELFWFVGCLWVSFRLRKLATCCFCQKALQKGDLALRPMTEDKRVRRYERLCVRHGHRPDY